MKVAFADLLHNPLIWRGDQLSSARAEDTVGSGYADLDCELPGGGWPKGSLTELLHDDEGIGELRLLLPALRRLRSSEQSTIVMIAPPHIPYAPALAAGGVALAQLLIVDAALDKDGWWAAEQVLRSKGVGAMLFWPRTLNDQHLRRLQLAAHDSRSLAFIFADTVRAAQPSPTPLRVRLTMAGANLGVDVFKRRGGVVRHPLSLALAAAPPATATVMPVDRPLIDVNKDADNVAGNNAGSLRINRSGHIHTPPALAANRLVNFKPHYPVGGPSAQIWNRALARADEVRRSPRPDPRGLKGRQREASAANGAGIVSR